MSFEKIDNDELRAAIRRFSVFLRADYVALDASIDKADFHSRQPDAWVPDEPGKNVVRIVHVGPS